MSEERKAQALRDASAGWREMGRHLEDTVRDLDHEVGRARATHWQGPAAESFTGDWARLRKSVDEALPVFELAAADLDRAADHAEQSAGRGDDPVAGREPAEPVQDVSASYNVMYALTALSQIGSALGATFGRGRGGGGGPRSGRAPLARSTPQPAPRAPSGADPFGPPETSKPPKKKPMGGLGVARGCRGPARGEDGPAPASADPAPPQPREDPEPKPPEGGSPTGAADPVPGTAPEPAPEPAPAARPQQPDPRRHGAFG